jgi:hypothetical protein
VLEHIERENILEVLEPPQLPPVAIDQSQSVTGRVTGGSRLEAPAEGGMNRIAHRQRPVCQLKLPKRALSTAQPVVGGAAAV